MGLLFPVLIIDGVRVDSPDAGMISQMKVPGHQSRRTECGNLTTGSIGSMRKHLFEMEEELCRAAGLERPDGVKDGNVCDLTILDREKEIALVDGDMGGPAQTGDGGRFIVSCPDPYFSILSETSMEREMRTNRVEENQRMLFFSETLKGHSDLRIGWIKKNNGIGNHDGRGDC